MKIKHQINKSSSAMAQLLESHKNSIVPLRKGEVIKGKISKLTRSEILVNLDAKAEALVLEKDKAILHTLLSTFKVGESVEVLVLTPESATGQPVVSLRRYLGNLTWGRLEELIKLKEMIEVTVADVVKSGYIVKTSFGISGFLPQSHISYQGNQDLSLGDIISVNVLELSRKDNKVIFSQKPTFTDDDFANLTSKLKSDKKVTVEIVNIAPFGLFVTIPVKGSDVPLEGFIHISEIAWEKTVELSNLFTVGQQIEAAIIKFDTEGRKVQLSVKRLTKDPFEEIMAAYPVDKKIEGTVEKVEEVGITVRLEDAEGFMRRAKLPLSATYTVGQKITALVSEYDKKRKRVFLVPVLLEKPLGYR